MSKFEQIVTFIHVVEEGSFAAAARKENQSTAAISRKISSLEDALGVQLLLRSTRQIGLTDVGKHYYEQCKKTLEAFSETENIITGCKDGACGTLSIMSSRFFGMEYLIPHLSDFMAQNPKLSIKLDLAERFPDLTQEGIDLLFGISLDGPEELVRRKVAVTQYVICASPNYIKKFGEPKTPADLVNHRYIAHSARKPANVLHFVEGKEVYVEPVLYMNDSRGIKECALRDMGLAKLHCYIVKDALKSGQLVEVLKEYKEPIQPVYLYYQQSRYLQPKIRKFIDFYIPHMEGKT